MPESINLGTINIGLNLDLGSLSKASGQAKQEIKTLDAQIVHLTANVNIANAKFGAAGKSAEGMTKGLRGAVVAGSLLAQGLQTATGVVEGLFARTVKISADTQESLNVLRMQTQATNAQFKELSATARQLGSDVALPGTNSAIAAEAMTELSRAGLNLQDTMNGARGVLLLMDATQASGADSARAVASALNIYGLAGTESTRVANLFAAANLNGVKDLGSLTDAVKYFGPAAKEFHISIDDSVVQLSILAKAGFQGTMAGTALRESWNRLAEAKGKAQEALKAVGVAIYDTNHQMRDARSIMADLQQAEAKMNEEERNRFNKLVFGERAQGAMNVLLSESAGNYDKLRDKIAGTNSAEELAKAHMDGFNGSMKALTTSTDSFLEKYGHHFLDFLTNVVRTGSDAIGVLDGLIQKQKDVSDGSAANGKTDDSMFQKTGPLGFIPKNIADAQEILRLNNSTLAFENSDKGNISQTISDIADLRDQQKAIRDRIRYLKSPERDREQRNHGVFDSADALQGRFLADKKEIADQSAAYSEIDRKAAEKQRAVTTWLAAQKSAKTSGAKKPGSPKPNPHPSPNGNKALDDILSGAKDGRQSDAEKLADQIAESRKKAAELFGKASSEESENAFARLLSDYRENGGIKNYRALENMIPVIAGKKKAEQKLELSHADAGSRPEAQAAYQIAIRPGGTIDQESASKVRGLNDALTERNKIAEESAKKVLEAAQAARAAEVDDAQSATEQSRNILQAGTWKIEQDLKSGRISHSVAIQGIQDIAEMVKAIDGEGSSYVALQERIRELGQEQFEQDLRIAEFQYKHGSQSTEQYLAFLNEKLAATKQYSDEWFSIYDKIDAVEKKTAKEAAKEARDSAREMRQLFGGVAKDIGRAADDAINRWNGFRSFFKSLGADIKHIFADVVKTMVANWAKMQLLGAAKSGISHDAPGLGNLGAMVAGIFGHKSKAAGIPDPHAGGDVAGQVAAAAGAAGAGGGSGGIGALAGIFGKGGALAGHLGAFGAAMPWLGAGFALNGVLGNPLGKLFKHFRFAEGGNIPAAGGYVAESGTGGEYIVPRTPSMALPVSLLNRLGNHAAQAAHAATSAPAAAGDTHVHLHYSGDPSEISTGAIRRIGEELGWHVRRQLPTARAEAW
jgi:TP901 family phage tail tape measure protein